MKYRITPGNMFFVLSVCVLVYFYFLNTDRGNILGAGYILFFSLFVLIGDFFLQYFIDDYRRLILIECISLPVIIFLALVS